MARRAAVLLVSFLALAACSRPAASDAPEAAADVPAEAPAAAGAVAKLVPPPSKAPLETAPQLAYSYEYDITAPPKAVRALAAKHEAACQAAGATVCQVTGASVSEEGSDQVRASLSIRATPAWLKTFRAGLADQAEKAGGRVASAVTNTEDLSRALVDTEAALRAKITLRDRLQSLLANRPGKLSELLELEQALAQAQGEIDATQSELAVMRTRVATSKLDISYASMGVLAPDGAGAPISQAVSEIAGGLAMTAAIMIRLLTWAGPWALLIGGGGWLWMKRRGKVRPARPERAKAEGVEPSQGPTP